MYLAKKQKILTSNSVFIITIKTEYLRRLRASEPRITVRQLQLDLRPVNFYSLYGIFPETIFVILVTHKVCESVNGLESKVDCLIQRRSLTGQVVQFTKQTGNVHIELQTCTWSYD